MRLLLKSFIVVKNILLIALDLCNLYIINKYIVNILLIFQVIIYFNIYLLLFNDSSFIMIHP